MLACTRLALHKGKEMARLELGFSPFSKTIQLAKMKDLGNGVRQRVGNDRGRDVTNEAAQMVWQLVMSEGGRVEWSLDDGSKMVLEANKQLPKHSAAQLRAETDTTPSQYESLAGGK